LKTEVGGRKGRHKPVIKAENQRTQAPEIREVNPVGYYRNKYTDKYDQKYSNSCCTFNVALLYQHIRQN